jgi:hypothetical protein
MRWLERAGPGRPFLLWLHIRGERVVDPSIELLGVPASQPFDGLTLLPLLRGEETAARVALVENLLFRRRTGRPADGRAEVRPLGHG